MSDLAFNVLRKLSDGAFHSGETLASAFGVSRTSIWNAVDQLARTGIDVFRVRGRGYRLASAISMLDAGAIRRALGSVANRCALHVLDTVESTNTVAMRHAHRKAPAGTVIAAELQTEGRGRMGRRWHAGLGTGLTFSMLWQFAQGAGFLSGLSLATGIAVVRGLTRLGAADIRLKWPNDILWHDRKLAGILLEVQGDALGPSTVVIGIGLNIRPVRQSVTPLDQPVADLEEICGRVLDRNRVLGVVLVELVAVLDAFSRSGFGPLRHEWQRFHAHQNRAVVLRAPGAPAWHGIARGVGADGALIVETTRGQRHVHSGEVSLRAAPAVRADHGVPS